MVIDGITKKEIMKIKRVQEDITELKDNNDVVVVGSNYYFQVGEVVLYLMPEKHDPDSVIIKYPIDITTTDDLGNISTSKSFNNDGLIKIFNGSLTYTNFTVKPILQVKARCCSCENNGSCSIMCCCGCLASAVLDIVTTFCPFCKLCFDCRNCKCDCNCGGGNNNNPRNSGGNSNAGASVIQTQDIWYNAGTNESKCCKPARSRTTTTIMYK